MIRPKASGSRTWRRHARAICSSCPTLGDEPWEGGWLSAAEPRAVSSDRLAARQADAGRDVRRSSRRTPSCGARTTRPPRHRRSAPGEHTLRRRVTPCRLVGSERARPREEAAVRCASRGSDRQGRAEARRRGWPRRIRSLGARARRGAGIGLVPSCRVQTVREAAEAATTALHEIRILDVRDPAELERTGGVNFGALVHELLARASFDASAESLVDLALLHARLLDLAADEASAAAKVAHRALAVDLMKQGPRRRPAWRVPARDAGHASSGRRHARRGHDRSGVRGSRTLDGRGLQDRPRTPCANAELRSSGAALRGRCRRGDGLAGGRGHHADLRRSAEASRSFALLAPPYGARACRRARETRSVARLSEDRQERERIHARAVRANGPVQVRAGDATRGANAADDRPSRPRSSPSCTSNADRCASIENSPSP